MNLKTSYSLWERARRVMPGGVGGSGCRGLPLWDPYWPFLERGQGSKVYDLDGNEWIDYTAAYGPLILGHAPTKVLEAVKTQLELGTMHGMCHELEVKVAEKIVQYVPSAEMVKFSNTGTEAVLHAVRLARAHTGREKVIKFEGAYHGWADALLLSVSPTLESAGSPEAPKTVLAVQGQARSVAEDMIVMPWNDLEPLEEVVAKSGDQIAAILVEPYLHNSGCIPPREGFLERVRRLTEDSGIVLIFDEVITGFRLALGGAQEYLGITPDLTVFAKAIGGGFPAAAVAGKKEIMESAVPGRADWYGTYNASPLVLSAVLATLEELEDEDGKVYSRLFGFGEKVMRGLRESAAKWGVNMVVQGPGPSWSIFFTDLKEITNYREATQSDKQQYQEFWEELMRKGVMFHPYHLHPCYITAAHTEEDVEHTLTAIDEALRTVGGV